MSRLLGSAVSVAVHGLVALHLLRPLIPPVRAARANAAPAQPGVEIFVVSQPEMGEAPGLKYFKKVLERSSLLFPIASSGLSLDAFGLLPAFDRSRRLYNPSRAVIRNRESSPPLSLSERGLQSIGNPVL